MSVVRRVKLHASTSLCWASKGTLTRAEALATGYADDLRAREQRKVQRNGAKVDPNPSMRL